MCTNLLQSPPGLISLLQHLAQLYANLLNASFGLLVTSTQARTLGQCRRCLINGLKFLGQNQRLGWAVDFEENPYCTERTSEFQTITYDTSNFITLPNSRNAVSDDGPGVVPGRKWSFNTDFKVCLTREIYLKLNY